MSFPPDAPPAGDFGFMPSPFGAAAGVAAPTAAATRGGGKPPPAYPPLPAWGAPHPGAPAFGTGASGFGPGIGDAGAFAAAPEEEDFSNEPPLLQELGVDFGHIRTKVVSVLNITKAIDETVMADADMAGPVFFALVLGTCLLLTGKAHFGYIYGFGMLGSLAIYVIVNLMAESAHSIDVMRTFSILGYSLLPVVVLAAVAVFIDLRGAAGAAMGAAAIAWCTQSATRFFEGALHMRPQRYLIAYPALLFYACFTLITVF